MVAIQPQYVLRAFGVFFKNTLDLSQKYTMRNTRKLRGVSRTSAGGHGFKKKCVLRCFAVFCGVLRCFVCVFLAFLTKQTKQTKKYTKRTKRTKYALCNTAQYGAVRLSLTQKMSTKNIRKTRPKHCKTSAKHRKTPQNTLFQKNTRKTPQNTRKTPAKHRKTPQNTTKQFC